MDFSKVRNYVFIGALTGISIAFLYVVLPFAYPVFWAAVLAALFHPLFIRIDKLIKHPSLTSLIILMLVAVIVIVPFVILGTILVKESINLYGELNNNQGSIGGLLGKLSDTLTNNPYLSRFHFNETDLGQRLTDISRTAINFIFNTASRLTQNSLEFVGYFLIMLYTLFFFVRDGEKILKKLMFLVPLGDRYEKKLYHKFTSAAAGTIRGTLLMGGLQGALGGILFAVAGIPGSLIWGILMTLLAVIPATGSFFVWVPAGIIMIITGQIWKGVMILIVGTILISTIDNFLRPIVVGRDISMHPLIVLFSTLGGLLFFGISGFVIGPIIAALFLSFWEMYTEYYQSELADN